MTASEGMVSYFALYYFLLVVSRKTSYKNSGLRPTFFGEMTKAAACDLAAAILMKTKRSAKQNRLCAVDQEFRFEGGMYTGCMVQGTIEPVQTGVELRINGTADPR